jgi:hypothetical protein
MEPRDADETWGKLGGEVVPVPIIAPVEAAEATLLEALWLMQLRLWTQMIETWCGHSRDRPAFGSK